MSEPYYIKVTFVQGHEEILWRGHNPLEGTAYGRDRVAHDPKTISRVVLCDGGGILDVIWADFWEKNV